MGESFFDDDCSELSLYDLVELHQELDEMLRESRHSDSDLLQFRLGSPDAITEDACSAADRLFDLMRRAKTPAASAQRPVAPSCLHLVAPS